MFIEDLPQGLIELASKKLVETVDEPPKAAEEDPAHRLRSEYKNRLASGIRRIAGNTPAPKTPEGELYYTRMHEILTHLTSEGVNHGIKRE